MIVFTLGYFAEGDDEHYVTLHDDLVYQNLHVRSPDHNDTSFESPEEEGVLNKDVQEKVIMSTLTMYPYMPQTLQAVSSFFKYAVDR